jgi:hypothetical protein
LVYAASLGISGAGMRNLEAGPLALAAGAERFGSYPPVLVSLLVIPVAVITAAFVVGYPRCVGPWGETLT